MQGHIQWGKGRKVASSSRTRILRSTPQLKRRRPYRHDWTGTRRMSSRRDSLHSCSGLPPAGPDTEQDREKQSRETMETTTDRSQKNQRTAVLAATIRMRQFGQNARRCWRAGVSRSGWYTGAPSNFGRMQSTCTLGPQHRAGHGTMARCHAAVWIGWIGWIGWLESG